MRNEFDYLNDVQIDFSKYEAMELTDKERMNMKKAVKEKKPRFSWKKCAVIAACVASIAIVAQTGFAQDIMSHIVKVVMTGHNDVIQMEDSAITRNVPEELIGCFFDADGNEVTELTDGRGYTDLYSKDGVKYDDESLTNLFIEKGIIKTDTEVSIHVAPADDGSAIPETDESRIVFTSESELQSGLNFALKAPEYLPEGYSFLYGVGFRKNDGTMSGDYAMMAYSDGEQKFTVHERIINENTRYSMGTNSELTEGIINGCTAAITDYEITWEQDGISVAILSGMSDVTGDKLLKVANSVK